MFRVTRKRPNPRRWFYRVGFVVLGLLVGELIVQFVYLPHLIRGKVDAALRQLGVSSPAFEVSDAGLWRTELRNVSDRPGEGDASPRLRIGAVSIIYGPVDASGGKIESITLRGAELFATLKDGKLDLGPFSHRPASPDDGKPIDLPFRRLRLESSTIHLDWEGQTWWLPVSGVLTNAGAGRLTLDAHTFAAGSPVTLTANVDPALGETTAELSASDANLASLISTVPVRLLPSEARAGGRAALSLSYHEGRARREAIVKIEPHDAWAHLVVGGKPLDAERFTLKGETTIDIATGRPTALTLAGDFGRLTVAGQVVRGAKVDVHPHDDSLGFSITASSDGWRIGRFEGDARGFVFPADASMTSPTLDVPVSFTANYQVSGNLPPSLRQALAANGIDLSHVGDVEVEGESEGFVHLHPPADGRDAWHLQTEAAQVSLAPADLAIGDRATVRALAASLKLRAQAGPREAVVRLLEDSWIDWQAVVGNDASKPLVGGDVHLGLLPADGSLPALRIGFTDADPDVTAALRLRTDGPVSFSGAGTEVRAATVEWSGSFHLPADSSPVSLDSTLTVAGGSVAHAASGTSIGKIDLSVPITLNHAAAGPGTLTAGSIKAGGRDLPPIKGSLAIAGPRATFGAAWSPLAGADVSAQGSVELDGKGASLTGDADLSLKSFKLTDGTVLASALPAAKGWDVTGTLGAAAHVSLRGGKLEERAKVSIADVSAHDAGRSLSVEGLTGDVTLDSFAPLTTPGAQRLVASKFTTGKLALAEGAVDFRVEGPRSILIEQTNWGWAGGRVYSHAFRVDPQKPDVDVVLYAEGLRVADLLALVADNRATGEGDLFGRVPLVVRWPKVTFGNGFLYTRPGADGDLKFLDESTASAMLDQADPRFKSEGNFALVKQRVLDALRDFQYDRLRVDLVNDTTTKDGQLVAHVNVHGKGKTGPKPQELDLTLNFRGLDEPLNAYVGFEQWLSNIGGGEEKKKN